MTAAALLLLLAAGLSAGCAELDPYATTPLAAKPGVKDAGTRVGICYNTLRSSPSKVQEAAQAECAAGTTAEQIDTDYQVQFCPLLLPGRATFICRPKS